MKKKTVLPVVLIFLTGLAGCSGELPPEELSRPPELLEPVDVKMDMAMAQRGELYNLSVYSGEIVPYTEELYFTVDGCLEEFKVMIGDMAEEGQILASLSEEQTLEQIETLEKEIDNLVRMGEFSDRQAGADIEIARTELEYMRALGKFGYAVDAKELEVCKLELAQQEAEELRNLELQKKQEALRTLQGKIGKNEITAPCSGRIVYISSAGKGDFVQGYVPVIYMADESRLSLSTEFISESAIKGADRVYARIGSREFDITYIPYDREEMTKAALAGEEMRTRFSIDEADTELAAGQFAVVMVYHFCKENALTIPINALHRDGSGQYVYKQVNGARVRCDVKTGMLTNTKAEITEGLEEGDMVYVQD